ncbi:MAG TPA: carboxypeptidase regulatory-like domain-containing protein, partial [Pyrinomonadaceae bacterium]|nr:carboxypeptidase regulatory-like domain-containing protein [Pyrinomonadaceae bacterium]
NAQIEAGDVTVIRGYNLGVLNGVPITTKPVCGPTAPVTTSPVEPNARTASPEVGRTIRAVNTQWNFTPTVTVDLQLDAIGDEASTSFSLNWNPAIFTYVSSNMGGGTPAGTNLGLNTNQTGQGRLGVLLDATNTYGAGPRQLLTITFSVAANASPGVYPITFSDTPTAKSVSSAQGALLPTTFEAGNIVVHPTAAGVSVSGRVINANGQGVRGATVVITDPSGNRRAVTTGSFGFYSFDSIEAGRAYIVSVRSSRYRFSARTVTVRDTLTDIDFVAQE